jgi:hypothetical protein
MFECASNFDQLCWGCQLSFVYQGPTQTNIHLLLYFYIACQKDRLFVNGRAILLYRTADKMGQILPRCDIIHNFPAQSMSVPLLLSTWNILRCADV